MKLHDPFSALRIKDFRLFLSAKFLITVAGQMQAIIASWLIYEKTKDPFSLGLIGLAEAIPALALALPGGLIADRFSRKKIMFFSTLLMILSSLVLCLYTYPDLVVHFSDNWIFNSVGTLYLIIFLVGLARGFYVPAQAAYWAQILPKEKYVNASVWNSSLWQIGVVAGPALGGIFYGQLGAFSTSVIVLSLMLAVAILITFFTPTLVLHHANNETIKESIQTGIRYFFKHPILLSAVSLDLFAVLFGGAVALLPAFADSVLHAGPEGLGYLRSAPAIGAVTMSLIMAFYPPHQGAGKKMLICVAGFGACMIAFALSTSFVLSFFILMLSGMFDNVSVVIRSTILQTHTPDEMRGRIAAVNSIFVGSSNELGAFESGLAARYLGLINSVIFGGMMTLIVVLITQKMAPSLKKLTI
ncbi:MAG: MFS transporter [Bacteroidota bacterium]